MGSFRRNEGHDRTRPIRIWLKIEYIVVFYEDRTCAKNLWPISNSFRENLVNSLIFASRRRLAQIGTSKTIVSSALTIGVNRMQFGLGFQKGHWFDNIGSYLDFSFYNPLFSLGFEKIPRIVKVNFLLTPQSDFQFLGLGLKLIASLLRSIP